MAGHRDALREEAPSIAALPLEPGADDQAVLNAVIEHYVASLADHESARVVLAKLGIDEATAATYRVGFSDRTLGLRLPGRRWKHGGELRSQLIRLGVYRPSGHEHFVGCLVVPLLDPEGSVVGMVGRRIDRNSGDLIAEGLPGLWFNESAVSDWVLIVRSAFEALAVIGAGHSEVTAPAHGGAVSRKDARWLANHGVGQATLFGSHEDLSEEHLRKEGIEATVVDPHVAITDVLATATDRAAALDALLRTSRSDETEPTMSERPSTRAAAAVLADGEWPMVTGDRSELHIRFPERRWRVRAGVRASSYDALRVALSVTDERSGRFHLDTLDLYQARARDAFVTAAVSELHTSGEALRHELAEVIFAVERSQEGVDDEKPEFTMSDAERESATELLSDPDLIGRVREDLASLGVVGEATNLLVAYLSTISRKADRPFGVVIQSSSAAGKSTLADAVASLIPPEELVSLSAITGQALYYLGPNDLSHKVLFVSEEQGASRASYALKLLVTEGRLAIASAGKDPETGQLRTKSYSVEGPVALLMTTTATEIDPELQNRLVVLGVDEDRAQTRAIHVAQRHGATLDGLLARLRREEVVTLHRNAQRLLEPIPVVIPDAEALTFPDFATRHRRDQQKLLALIAAITLLHQRQRTEQTIEVGGTIVRYLEATADDVALGCALGEEILLRGADELAPQARRLLAVMEAMTEEGEVSQPPVTFTRRELRELTGWSEHQVRVGLERLVTLEYVAAHRDVPGRRHTYVLVDPATPREGARAVREADSRTESADLPAEAPERATDAATTEKIGRNVRAGAVGAGR